MKKFYYRGQTNIIYDLLEIIKTKDTLTNTFTDFAVYTTKGGGDKVSIPYSHFIDNFQLVDDGGENVLEGEKVVECLLSDVEGYRDEIKAMLETYLKTDNQVLKGWREWFNGCES